MNVLRTVLPLLALFVVASLAIRAPPQEFRKKLAGPPSEFGSFRIPSPSQTAQQTSAAFEHITLSSNEDGSFSWDGEVLVDSTTMFAIGIFSPVEDSISISVTFEDGSKLPKATKNVSPFGIDGDTFPVISWVWNKPKAGLWKLKVSTPKSLTVPQRKAIVVSYNESPVKLSAHINTYDLQVDQEIGIVASMVDATDQLNVVPLALKSLSAIMEVTYPGGKEVYIPMKDKSLTSGLSSDAGVYAAVLEATEPGRYTAQAIFRGTTHSGKSFIRTTQHLFQVIEPEVVITGLSFSQYDKEKDIMYFHIDVDTLPTAQLKMKSEDGLTVKAYAEVWGTDSTGYEYAPAAWMQAMVDVTDVDGNEVITLQLDGKWLHMAKVSAPFQLRNVWIEERNSNVPYSERSKIFVNSKKDPNPFVPKVHLQNLPITEEMRNGPKPKQLQVEANAAAPSLFLVHGYCAGSNEFPTSQFTNAALFTDFKKSKSNDQFALEIDAQAKSKGMTAYSIVAHSQGGLASLHLYTYYFSGLDLTTSGTAPIQSVGSPYGGSTLAGSLAGIGNWFGVGCGSNYDLTHEGASLWKKGIPDDKSKDVYYYTTVYGTKGYCAWGANMVLDGINDGTTEISYSTVGKANNMGSQVDWCHTTGMIYTAQCTDPKRNAEMNANARR